MQSGKWENRTFLRTTLDIFLDNTIVKTIAALVNFCKEFQYYNRKELKFLEKMPMNNLGSNSLDNKFLFKVNR